MATCIADEILSRLVDDELSRDEQSRVLDHVETCSSCQDRLAEFRAAATLLAAAMQPVVEVTESAAAPDLLARLCDLGGSSKRRQRKPSRRSRAARRRRHVGGVPAAGIAAALVAVAIGLLVFISAAPNRDAHQIRRATHRERTDRTEVTKRVDPDRQYRSQIKNEQPARPRREDPPVHVTPSIESQQQEPESIAPTLPPIPELPARTPARIAESGDDTERPIARIIRVQGRVSYSRGSQGKSAAAIAGLQLMASDQVNIGAGTMQLEFEGGATVFVNRKTQLRLLSQGDKGLQAHRVHMERGEIFVMDGETRNIHVETPDGLFTPVGTRFDVKRSLSATILIVEQGAVEAQAKKSDAKVRVRAGYRSRVVHGVRPAKPVKVDTRKALAWIPARVDKDLQVLYRFNEGRGQVVRDVSGVGRPLDLSLAGTGWRWEKNGGLTFIGKNHNSIASSHSPTKKIIDACTARNEITIEAWMRPSSLDQLGPARIVAFDDPRGAPANMRNFEVNQGRFLTESDGGRGGRIDFRLRTANSDTFGHIDQLTPIGTLNKLNTLHHVVCTYSPDSGMRVYVNGKLITANRESGSLNAAGVHAWGKNFVLSLGNRTTSLDRDWQGTLHLVAVYGRRLERSEIGRNYAIGPLSGPAEGR